MPYQRCPQRFTSIFTKQKQEIVNAAAETNSDSDCKISECSSISSNEENQETKAPIRISWYSSDEDEQSKTQSFNNSIVSERQQLDCHNFSWKKRAKKRQRLPPKRPLSEVHIRSRVKQRTENVDSARILTQQNINTCIEKMCEPTSPWQKVRSVFHPVKRLLSCRFVQNVREEKTMGRTTVDNKSLNETEIDWSSSSESDGEFEKDSSQHISTAGSITQKSDPPTELDLLLALIERESNTNGKKQKSKVTKKSCLKGGFLHELQRTLEIAKTDRKFLEHDKKYGLQSGICLKILELQTSFGVHMATVETVLNEIPVNIFRVLLDVKMANQLKVGDKVEGFFNEAFEPYFISNKTDLSIPVYVQPNKVLLL